MKKSADLLAPFWITILGLLVCLVICGTVVIADDQESGNTAGTDTEVSAIPEGQRTFDQFVTIRVDDVLLAAGFQIAHLRLGEESEYVPIVLAMQSFKHKMWNIKMKDFTFTAEDGSEIEPVSLKVVRKEYSRYSEDYTFITRTTTLQQLLPSADITIVNSKERVGAADEAQADGRVGGFGGADISLPDSPSGGFYRHTLFYPRPGQTAVYSVTLDFKQFFYDVVYFKTSDILGKPIKVAVPAKKKRPALEIMFLIKNTD